MKYGSESEWKCTCWQKERNKFIRAIKKANYDRNKAAKLLKLSRATFFRYAKQVMWSLIKKKSLGVDMSSSGGPAVYAPDYLRCQKDEQLHLIAKMIEDQCDILAKYRQENEKLRAVVKVYEKELSDLRSSMVWYNDIFKGSDHEFQHAWRVEWPTQIEEALDQGQALKGSDGK